MDHLPLDEDVPITRLADRNPMLNAPSQRNMNNELAKCSIYGDVSEKRQYAVLQEGSDEEVADKGEAVLVHYTGWLKDGTRFDSSLTREKPFSFQLGAGGVIKGWETGVEGMKVGEKRLLDIPSHLAYGERERGAIPANSPLLFEVELLATSSEVTRPQ